MPMFDGDGRLFAGLRRWCARFYCIAALGLVVAGELPGAEQQNAPRPNIVFILMDDVRWDDLTCVGHPFC